MILKLVYRRLNENYKMTILMLIGLAIGIAASLVILTKVRYEKSFDNFHTNSKNLYRVVRFTSGLKYLNGALEYRAGIQFPIPGEIKKTIPEVTAVTSLLYIYGNKITAPQSGAQKPVSFNLKEGIVFADPQFFNVFDYADNPILWIAGNKQEALQEISSVIITRDIEKLLFAGQSGVDKIISIGNNDFTVKAVIDKFPVNSDFPFKIMISMSTLTEKIYKGATTDWGSISDNFQCFVKTRKDANVEFINTKLNKILKDHLPEKEASIRSMKLQPLREVHRDEKFGNFNHHTISNLILNALSILAAFILVIVGLNFSSGLIAQSIKHNTENSIRRIVGCGKYEIFKGFFSQALTLTIIAAILGIVAAYFVLKTQENLVGVPREFYMHFGYKPILTIVLIILSLSFIASIFPGMFFTSKPALSALKQNEKGKLTNKNNINKVTIVVQFAAASVLMISTMVILKQLSYISNKDLGYTPQGIISASIPDNTPSKIAALNARLLACPDVSGISFCSGNPAKAQGWFGVSLKYHGKQLEFDSELKYADTAFFSLNGFKLIAGRNYSKTDTFISAMVNKEFLAETGLHDPAELLGLHVDGMSRRGAIIVGVVNNSHSSSLHEKLRPCLFTNSSKRFQEIEIKLNPVIQKINRSQQLKQITGIWKEIFTDEDSEFIYLTDQIESYYKAEKNLFFMLLLFTGITGFLCCLGIFGLSVFIGEQRLNEIGIRKVNGARSSQIIIMLNSSYMKWIIIAYAIACPIGYYITNKWLQNFAYKTELSWWVFAGAGLMTLMIALFTVSWQSWRAATRNPVEALRYE